MLDSRINNILFFLTFCPSVNFISVTIPFTSDVTSIESSALRLPTTSISTIISSILTCFASIAVGGLSALVLLLLLLSTPVIIDQLSHNNQTVVPIKMTVKI